MAMPSLHHIKVAVLSSPLIGLVMHMPRGCSLTLSGSQGLTPNRQKKSHFWFVQGRAHYGPKLCRGRNLYMGSLEAANTSLSEYSTGLPGSHCPVCLTCPSSRSAEGDQRQPRSLRWRYGWGNYTEHTGTGFQGSVVLPSSGSK